MLYPMILNPLFSLFLAKVRFFFRIKKLFRTYLRSKQLKVGVYRAFALLRMTR